MTVSAKAVAGLVLSATLAASGSPARALAEASTPTLAMPSPALAAVALSKSSAIVCVVISSKHNVTPFGL
nr:hypothetical protein [uncultured Pseudodesulfovibrio sp.]